MLSRSDPAKSRLGTKRGERGVSTPNGLDIGYGAFPGSSSYPSLAELYVRSARPASRRNSMRGRESSVISGMRNAVRTATLFRRRSQSRSFWHFRLPPDHTAV